MGVACLAGLFIMFVVGATSKLTAQQAEIALQDALRVELQTGAQTAAKMIDGTDFEKLQGNVSSPESQAAFEAMRRFSEGDRHLARVFACRMTRPGHVQILFDYRRGGSTTVSPVVPTADSVLQATFRGRMALAEAEPVASGTGKVYRAYAPILSERGEVTGVAGIELPTDKTEMRRRDIGGSVATGWLIGAMLGLLTGVVVFTIRMRQTAESRALEHAKRLLEENNESLEEHVAQRTEELRQALEAKAVFLTTAGHELRTPLNGLIGMAALALDTSLSEDQKLYLTHAKESAENITQKINQLLDLASLESGQLRLEYEPTNVAEEVRKTADQYTTKAAGQKLSFVYWVDPDLNRKYFTPRKRLLQVVDNLLDNALKFTDTGQIEFTAGLIRRGDGTTWIDLIVQDTGVGIENEIKERIFEHRDSFVSLPSNKSGLGIGLAISRRICHLMGGVIEVSDEVKTGARFRVSFPLPPAEAGLVA